MSKYHEFVCEFKDRDSLVAGLKDMGYPIVEVHDVAQNLVGYHGDRRQEKANIIVRRKDVGPAANDLGFIKKSNGSFAAIVSEFDSGKHNASWFIGLKKAYGENAAIKVAAKNGFKYLGKKINATTGRQQMQWLDARG